LRLDIGTLLIASFFSFAAFPAMSAPPLNSRTSQAASEARISVGVEGEGPDVILVPGLASSRDVWKSTAERLKRRYRLHLVQVAGFAGAVPGPNASGKVAAPVAEAIADYIARTGLKAPAIIGHSLGGEVALMLAARHPEQVGRLLVVDALPFFSLLLDPMATSERAAPGAALFRDSMLAASKEQADAMQAASIARLVKTPSARAAVAEAGARSDQATVANATYELMTTDLRAELSKIEVPVQVIYAFDPLFGVPAAHVDALFRSAYVGLKGVRFTRIDDSFHFIMLDQAQRFNDIVEETLALEGAAPSKP
jgi:pimeloyl-ACP methyl ester carboxylesterase